ncbi:hypothetical protein B0H10DRAFT_1958716 [Mycena sp. CBHHK59/15]|nr:hypothetical protein B0H10DRAFT_1958716 [Mycena sp. CBHHK59/15]
MRFSVALPSLLALAATARGSPVKRSVSQDVFDDLLFGGELVPLAADNSFDTMQTCAPQTASPPRSPCRSASGTTVRIRPYIISRHPTHNPRPGVEFWQTADPAVADTLEQCAPGGEDKTCSASLFSDGFTPTHLAYFGLHFDTPFCS